MDQESLNPQIIIKDNWLTKKPREDAFVIMLMQALIFFSIGFIYLNNSFGSKTWMNATPDSVFIHKEYWRLWTSLFAHGDLGHLLSNASLFIPLTFLLSGYFGIFIFPIVGIALGGLINLLVLSSFSSNIALIGMSGVVYWMGAMWLTLFLLIDKRKSLKRRFAGALFTAVILFAPETYKPEVSYLSHFIGFMLGILSALIFYNMHREKFLSAEVKEIVVEDTSYDE